MLGIAVLVWLYSNFGSITLPEGRDLFVRQKIVSHALRYIGTPYVWGATGGRGFDCAGLVQRVYSDLGLPLPRTSREQFFIGVEVASDDLRPGDLVFFRDTYRKGISHVGIYAGNGIFIHSSSSRRRVLAEPLSSPYYVARYAGARRIIPALSTPPASPSILLTSDAVAH